jgi:hypothetical protein
MRETWETKEKGEGSLRGDGRKERKMGERVEMAQKQRRKSFGVR